MEYMLPNDGNPIRKIKKDDFYKKYKMLRPNEMKKYGGGVCWDYVTYQADYFRKNFPEVKYRTFYISLFNDNPNYNPTHTIFVYFLNRKVYWFESSWKRMCGVREFHSLKKCVSFVLQSMKEEEKKYGFEVSRYEIREYNALDKSLYGMGCQDYMDYMIYDQNTTSFSVETFIDYCDNMMIAKEGYLFSRKDFAYRMTKFYNGECNVVLVTGLSRSGKTTLASHLAADYPTGQLISLDVIEDTNAYLADESQIKLLNPCLRKFFSDPLGKQIIDWNLKEEGIPEDRLSDVMNDAICWVLDYASHHPNTPFFIEGIQIFLDADFQMIRDYPIIIKNTSMIKSFLRRKTKDFDMFRSYIDWEKVLRNFRLLERLQYEMENE